MEANCGVDGKIRPIFSGQKTNPPLNGALLGLTLFLVTFTAVGASPKRDVIPLDQIGAVAGMQYKGDGLSVVPTPEGAGLRCVFQKLQAQATPEGLWLASTAAASEGERFRVMAVAVGRESEEWSAAMLARPTAPTHPPALRGDSQRVTEACREHALLAREGKVELAGQAARYVRLGLTEEYSVSVDGLRQDFVVEERPEGTGPLRLGLEVTGARAEAWAGGARLALDGSGRKIAYSRLRATDAQGRELAARMEVASVADEAARLEPCGLAAHFPEAGSLTPKGAGGFLSGPGSSGQRWKAVERLPSKALLAIVVEDGGAAYPVRIDPTFSDDNWISLGGLAGADMGVSAAAADDAGNLYIGGIFSAVGNAVAAGVAKWDGSAWSALGLGLGSDSSISYVTALTASGTDVYVGGRFTYATNAGPSTVTVNYIAKWDGTAWSALGSGMSAAPGALAVLGADLYATGTFTTAGGDSAKGVAKWDGNTWSLLGLGMSAAPGVLAVSGTDLYAGGTFVYATNAGPATVTANRIAKWNGSTWSALGSGMDNSVYSLAVSGGTLYAGGRFTTAGGNAARRVAKWNGSTWSALGLGMDNSVYALAVSGTHLYAGGTFVYATNSGFGPSFVCLIAEWNGYAWWPLGSGMNIGSVQALVMSGGNLYAGGTFTAAGGNAANSVARWDGSSWSALGSGIAGGTGPSIRALAVSGT